MTLEMQAHFRTFRFALCVVFYRVAGGDIMSQGLLSVSVSLSLVCAQMRSQVPKLGTE